MRSPRIRGVAARTRAVASQGTTRSVVLVVSTALVVSATSATAASLITGKQIKDGSITSRDIKKGSISLNRLSAGSQSLIKKGITSPSPTIGGQTAPGNQGENGQTGPQGPAGTPGTNGTNGAPGANGTNGRNAGEPIDVTLADNAGWTFAPKGDNGDTTDNGTITFTGDAAAPLGTQVLDMKTISGKPVVSYLPVPGGAGQPLLSELTSAFYKTKLVTQPQTALDTSLQIEVTGSSATHFASGYTTLVYEPYQNGSPDTLNTWLKHNVTTGKVWSSQALPSGNCSQGAPCDFDTFIKENPNAVIQTMKLRIGQNSGAGWAGFEGLTDDVRVSFSDADTRYDLGN